MQLRNQFGDYAGGLEHALALATLAHAEYREAAVTSSTLYPVRMALALSDSDPDARTIALLHDVIEETDLTLDDLRQEGFPEHILDAVDHGNRRRSAPPTADVERLARYQAALRILDGPEQ